MSSTMSTTEASGPSSADARRRVPWREGFTEAAWLFIVLRVGISMLALYLVVAGGLPGPCHFELARNGWLTVPILDSEGPSFGLIGVWQRWDACWYGKIATYGYEPGTTSAGFWPMYPLLTGMVAQLLGMDVALAGLFVTSAAYIVAMAALYLLVEGDFGRAVARRTVVYLSVFPAALFLFAPFSEALFLALAVLAILGARRHQWSLAGIAVLAASLTRTQGLFLVLSLGWEAIRVSRAWWAQPKDARRSAAGVLLPPAAATLLPFVGFVGFSLYAKLTTGITPIDVQDTWGGNEIHMPWEVVAASWQWAVEHHDPLQFVNLATLVLFAGVGLAAIRRLPLAYSLYALPQIALLATRILPTPLTSTTRYLLVIFPVFVALALGVRGRRAELALITWSVLGLALFTTLFVRGDFIA